MRWRHVAQRIEPVCETAPAPTVAPAPDRSRDAEALAKALRLIDDLRGQLFVLQEQNQQLRKDLADRVCARLCTGPYRSAT